MGSRARAASYVVLDEAARRRRQRKALEALEQDNFHDDPHANLVMHKKAPKFEESLDGKTRPDRKRKARSFEYFKQRWGAIVQAIFCAFYYDVVKANSLDLCLYVMEFKTFKVHGTGKLMAEFNLLPCKIRRTNSSAIDTAIHLKYLAKPILSVITHLNPIRVANWVRYRAGVPKS